MDLESCFEKDGCREKTTGFGVVEESAGVEFHGGRLGFEGFAAAGFLSKGRGYCRKGKVDRLLSLRSGLNRYPMEKEKCLKK